MKGKNTQQLLKEYAEKFDDNFPTFMVRHLDMDEIGDLIEDCIKKNKPYEPESDISADY